MNLRTPRRRILLLVAGALAAGYATRYAADTYSFTPTTFRFLALFCDPQLSLCGAAREQAWWLLPYGFAALTALVLLRFVAPRVTTWVLRPMRDLVPVIAQLGPQNLGHRIRAGGSRRDEFAALCIAVDDMMDRIVAGYEGQRRFAANASHELRTPLAVQRTLIEVGMGQPLTDEQFTLLTAQLLQTNERNERLVDGLLVLSEADQGLAVRLPQRLDDIAAGVVAAHGARAVAAGVRLTSRLRPCTVRGEEVLLERLVTNLVQNAIKYNHRGGTVHVSVGDDTGADIGLIVVNTGQEVPPHAVAELFEPFKRLAADRIDHSGGAGLGLAIVRSITQAHAGTVTATAQQGGGLRVEVRLPVDDD
ncbi:HAMP domain-containing histidine kinase [Dactylosporangium sp. NBC_01737]|uniref:sensor histidine kinase n=1 Tax=Dactylosporangium sp. NBC_01737 TaxID=2975959 RepID=UPI002E138A6E|nr:HAMP domain-containing histidine kinase [Dactylosporangium sp. NBC_01737]